MLKYFIIFVAFLVLFSCRKDDYDITNLNNNEIIVLGHGGMGIGQTYPIDTYESIIKCLNSGAQGTEIDVQMTKDSVLVAFHSENLSDNTNLSGMINDYNWNEIKDAYYVNTPYLNYSILSLEQLFSNIDDIQSYKFTFDCKLYTNSETTVFQELYINALSRIINKYNLKDNVYLEFQDVNIIKRIKEKTLDYKLFIYKTSFEEAYTIATEQDLYGITISTENISKEEIEKSHNNNLYVAIWNTHTKGKNIEAIEKSPDFIQTDKVEYLVKMLE